MTEESGSERWRAGIVVIAALLTIGLVETVARSIEPPERELTAEPDERVRVYSRHLDRIGDEPSGSRLLLVGNSHSYALPGLQEGEPLREDSGGTVAFELADRLARDDSDLRVARLSHPNFLPMEMLLRVVHLVENGHRPDVILLGITWRNVARDSAVRGGIRTVFRNDAFRASLRRDLAGADDSVLAAIEADIRRVDEEIEAEQLQSDADALDEDVMNALGEHVALVGSSAKLRAGLYREVAFAIDELFVSETEGDYTYDVIDHDLALNLAALDALYRFCASHEIRVVAYLAPERADLTPLMDPARADEVLDALRALAGEHDVPLIDARTVVPSEYWGWVRSTPDRSHFTEPGHQRLADAIYAELPGLLR